MKRRNVFLFGAGATLGWKAPSTYELTKLVKETGFKISDNLSRITEFIYQKLLANGYEESDANFETIISIIEEFIIYYSQYNTEKKLPSLISLFFSPSYEEDLLNFSVNYGIRTFPYRLEIPKGKYYNFSKMSFNYETPEQFFFQHLLSELLTNINARISKYAYHTQGNTKIIKEDNQDINDLFFNWINTISQNSNIRMYTVNYDRVFKILLERNGISVFEGFDCGEYVPYREGMLLYPNIPKILNDCESNIHYNLHGSAFWEVRTRGRNQLHNPEIVLTPVPILEANNHEQAVIQIEKGKNLVLTNIITGYQKAQKSFISPYRQMQSAFDKDCCFADTIYIIGYSFGDEHINGSIKTVLKYNDKLKIHIVDPAYYDESENKPRYQLITKRFLNIFPELLYPPFIQKSIDETCFSYFDDKLFVHAIGFEEFMERNLW